MFVVVTVLLAWKFLKEVMRPIQWIGIMASFGGLALLTLV
jgi:drug/metabolite transporter (DMT)-like permease